MLHCWELIEYGILLKREYLLARNIQKRHREFDESEGVTEKFIASERLKRPDLGQVAMRLFQSQRNSSRLSV